jgi:hypothetical protein
MRSYRSPRTAWTPESRTRRARIALLVGATALLLGGCASAPPAEATARPATATRQVAPPPPNPALTLAALAEQARIVDGDTALQCVAYARAVSGIALYGDAGTWWRAAAGRYERSRRPEPGAVLVFRPTRTSVGHLAVVTRVIDARLVVASHANWLNNGRIHEDTPIEDVSAVGDWSAVRVWHTPSASWGRTRYAVAGFVLPEPPRIASR